MVNIINRLFVWFLLVFCLVCFVNAQPPLTTVFEGNSGLSILVPAPRFLIPGDVGRVSVHVFNLSNGVIFNGSFAECNAIVLWPNGSELYDGMASSHLDHFDFVLNLENVSLVGEYNWIVHCNTSKLGGFATGGFLLIPSGYEDNLQEAVIYCLLILLLFALFLFVFFICFSIDGGNEFDLGGNLVSINYGKYVKIMGFWVCYLLFWILDFFVWQVSQRFLLLSTFANVLEISFIIFSVLLIPVFLCFGAIMIVKVSLDSELHKLAKRGLKSRK